MFAESITPPSASQSQRNTQVFGQFLPSKHMCILTLALYLIIKSRVVKGYWRGRDVKENKRTHIVAVKESALPLHFICIPLITPLGIDPQIHRNTAERQSPHQELVATGLPSVEAPTHRGHWGFLHNSCQPKLLSLRGEPQPLLSHIIVSSYIYWFVFMVGWTIVEGPLVRLDKENPLLPAPWKEFI